MGKWKIAAKVYVEKKTVPGTRINPNSVHYQLSDLEQISALYPYIFASTTLGL